ncbi:hypothetical protein F9802_02030 [Bacillus aerolatus]|uniref:Spore coat protein n=1 Tax=Bacillus aerolatus TaxID=2653354 RepID=A0A6I1FQE7_9BACI|nr:YppG family protein [Bacillus aerolatus]KAB7708944.1 hypothetical protein F9802_02030 [Bacillus aerolatus]
MNPWEPMYPYPGHFPYHPPASYHGHQPSPPGYSQYSQHSQFSGDLWNHPLYQMQMPGGPYQMYPNASQRPPNAPGKKSSSQFLLQSFKNKDGSFDVNKAVDTAGMMVSTVSQLSKVVKDMTGWLKA